MALVTVTAPGRDVLPYDGDTGRVVAESRYRWNRDAPQRWRALHRAAAQVARRRHGRFSMVCATWEYQRRGVLHRHVVIGVASARERAAADTYANALHELRQEHGFGFVDRGRAHGGKRTLEVIPATRAARYVAKYLSPLDAAGKPTMSSTVVEPDVPPHVAHVSVRLTGLTGITMRSLRLRRQLWVVARQEGVDLHAFPLIVTPRVAEILKRGVPLPRPPCSGSDAPPDVALVAGVEGDE